MGKALDCQMSEPDARDDFRGFDSAQTFDPFWPIVSRGCGADRRSDPALINTRSGTSQKGHTG